MNKVSLKEAKERWDGWTKQQVNAESKQLFDKEGTWVEANGTPYLVCSRFVLKFVRQTTGVVGSMGFRDGRDEKVIRNRKLGFRIRAKLDNPFVRSIT